MLLVVLRIDVAADRTGGNTQKISFLMLIETVRPSGSR